MVRPLAGTQTISFDPSDPGFLTDPYPVLNRVREESRVFYEPQRERWFVTRHEDVRSCLRDKRLGRNFRHVLEPEEIGVPPLDSRWQAFWDSERWSLLWLEPPDHPRLRKLVAAAQAIENADRQIADPQAMHDALTAIAIAASDEPTAQMLWLSWATEQASAVSGSAGPHPVQNILTIITLVLGLVSFALGMVIRNAHTGAAYEIAGDQAVLVAEMFRRYADDGASIADLARWLTGQGVAPRTGKHRWDRSVIWGMLRTPAYAGRAVFGKTMVVHESPGLNRVAHVAHHDGNDGRGLFGGDSRLGTKPHRQKPPIHCSGRNSGEPGVQSRRICYGSAAFPEAEPQRRAALHVL